MIWRGGDAFEKRLKQATERLQREVPKAMTDVVARTHDAAVQRTPRDTGELQESSVGRVGGKVVSQGREFSAEQVATADKMGKTLTGKVAFRTDYAVKQHETLSYNHPGGGESKFLEKAALAEEPANKKRFQAVKVFKG